MVIGYWLTKAKAMKTTTILTKLVVAALIVLSIGGAEAQHSMHDAAAARDVPRITVSPWTFAVQVSAQTTVANAQAHYRLLQQKYPTALGNVPATIKHRKTALFPGSPKKPPAE
jgi:hypothetical protein